MKWALHKISTRFLKPDTWGALALAHFLICAVSGVFLAIPYDVQNAYESIVRLLLTNPAGSFVRNLHYWSAQFFLIFTLLHTWDFLTSGYGFKLKKGVWMRLVFSLIFVFYVMISGFILKADHDSQQAQRILQALVSGLPLFGNILSYSLIGEDGDFQILYVHHIATATIFLIIVIFEHAKTIWTNARTFFIIILQVSVLSFFFRAPLHDNLNPVVKGPWYFVGLQEILHWMSHPDWIFVLTFTFLAIIWFIPKTKASTAVYLRKVLYFSFLIYLILTCMAYFFRGENWQWDWKMRDVYFPFQPKTVEIIGTSDSLIARYNHLDGKKEGCLVCHSEMTGFSPAHDPLAIGCATCHLGDPYTVNKTQAHQHMVLIPGNLGNAHRTCGTAQCHPEITNRMQTSLMTTMNGVINVDRFVFGESGLDEIHSHIARIGHSAADQHLRDLCANCHLGNPKTDFGAVSQLSRGGGCNACHLNYSPAALNNLQENSAKSIEETSWNFHPSLSLNITDDHCFGCHSRSGRIATNYQGWHETLLEKEEVTDWEKYHQFDDERIFEKQIPDVHHQKGMACVDCHNSYETMGDGNLYPHKEFQVKVRCEDCHFRGTPNTISTSSLDQESGKIAQLRKYPADRQFLVFEKSGKAMLNTFMKDDGKKWLIAKNSGDTLPMIPPAKACSQGNAHKNLSCEACHTSWVPQCVGCHNAYEKNTPGFDMLENRDKMGAWVEFTGRFLADLPVLGVDERPEMTSGKAKKISTFANGMVLSVDLQSFDGKAGTKEIFRRLHAPVSAHTTITKGRSCKSCHNNPLAIGYGRGKLEFVSTGNAGRWQFTPHFAENKHDGLPEDAWIGFLKEPNGITSTRTGVRPFNIAEQKRMLEVGVCLSCHEEDSKVMIATLEDFDGLLRRISAKCSIVLW